MHATITTTSNDGTKTGLLILGSTVASLIFTVFAYATIGGMVAGGTHAVKKEVNSLVNASEMTSEEIADWGNPLDENFQHGYDAGWALRTDYSFADSDYDAELNCAELAEQAYGYTAEGAQMFSGCVAGWLDSK